MRRTVPVILSMVIGTGLITCPASAQDCATPHKQKRHNCFCPPPPPLAPVLGSAPALMSPIAFVPPRSPAYQNSVDTLKDLKALNDLMAELRRPANSPAKRAAETPVRMPSPDANQDCCDALEQRVDRLDGQIKSLQESVSNVEKLVLETLKSIDTRLENMDKK